MIRPALPPQQQRNVVAGHCPVLRRPSQRGAPVAEGPPVRLTMDDSRKVHPPSIRSVPTLNRTGLDSASSAGLRATSRIAARSAVSGAASADADRGIIKKTAKCLLDRPSLAGEVSHKP